MWISFELLGGAFAAFFTVVSATPVKRATQPSNSTDIDSTILQYALTLEHLELAFYTLGLATYSAYDFKCAGFPPFVRQRVTNIAYDEATHVKFLTEALTAGGYNATAACTYKFPDTSPATFLAIAQVLEGVGVSAYLGAASLITNPAYVTAAGAILTVEARHNTWLASSAFHQDGFPGPFDTPLDFDQVYTMASQFIVSCPETNPVLPVMAFPTLTLATTGSLTPGETIQLTYDNSTSATGAYAIFLSGLGQIAVSYDGATGNVAIPAEIYGQIYVVITSANATVTDTNVLAGPAVVAVDYPAQDVPY